MFHGNIFKQAHRQAVNQHPLMKHQSTTPPSRSVRLHTVTALMALTVLTTACGGGGSAAPVATPAPDPVATPAPAPAPACTQANFTVANFNALSVGMTLAQVNQTIGCQTSSNAVTQSAISYSWSSGSSLITVYFDAAGTTVTALGSTYKAAANLQFANAPIASACRQSNFIIANFNAISTGMTVAQVNQAIGCQTNGNAITPGAVNFSWSYGASLISVYFDAAGNAVTALGSTFKAAAGLANPSTPTTAACTQANFTVANFNAISLGMTLAQVSQVVGCQASSNAVTQGAVNYSWSSGSSLISVYFDAAGNAVTALGSTFKAAAGLANPSTPTTAACTQANFTVANFNAISLGMTLAQVSQVIGCQASSNAVTPSAVNYSWSSGSSLISVYFDSAGNAVTALGSTFKAAANLQFANPPTASVCAQSSFTFTNFNAITTGMTVAQVNQTIGCQTNGNAITQNAVNFSWSYGSSLISVYFDSAGTTVTPLGSTFKAAAGLN